MFLINCPVLVHRVLPLLLLGGPPGSMASVGGTDGSGRDREGSASQSNPIPSWVEGLRSEMSSRFTRLKQFNAHLVTQNSQVIKKVDGLD